VTPILFDRCSTLFSITVSGNPFPHADPLILTLRRARTMRRVCLYMPVDCLAHFVGIQPYPTLRVAGWPPSSHLDDLVPRVAHSSPAHYVAAKPILGARYPLTSLTLEGICFASSDDFLSILQTTSHADCPPLEWHRRRRSESAGGDSQLKLPSWRSSQLPFAQHRIATSRPGRRSRVAPTESSRV
jgi:hypothetical protein